MFTFLFGLMLFLKKLQHYILSWLCRNLSDFYISSWLCEECWRPVFVLLFCCVLTFPFVRNAPRVLFVNHPATDTLLCLCLFTLSGNVAPRLFWRGLAASYLTDLPMKSQTHSVGSGRTHNWSWQQSLPQCSTCTMLFKRHGKHLHWNSLTFKYQQSQKTEEGVLVVHLK